MDPVSSTSTVSYLYYLYSAIVSLSWRPSELTDRNVGLLYIAVCFVLVRYDVHWYCFILSIVTDLFLCPSEDHQSVLIETMGCYIAVSFVVCKVWFPLVLLHSHRFVSLSCMKTYEKTDRNVNCYITDFCLEHFTQSHKGCLYGHRFVSLSCLKTYESTDRNVNCYITYFCLEHFTQSHKGCMSFHPLKCCHQ